MSLQQNIKKIIFYFDGCQNNIERNEVILNLGDNLIPFAEEERNDKTFIGGCIAQVWIKIKYEKGKIIFCFDTDSLMAKGFLYIIQNIYSGLKPEEILADKMEWLEKLQIEQNLSPNRLHSFYNILKTIHNYARIYQQSGLR